MAENLELSVIKTGHSHEIIREDEKNNDKDFLDILISENNPDTGEPFSYEMYPKHHDQGLEGRLPKMNYLTQVIKESLITFTRIVYSNLLNYSRNLNSLSYSIISRKSSF
ncbi:hypothetical protein Glove_300g68 [Diversispora epigaea]|uniref:Uncharacterized protein n=1 Tax=Diversispora epigaea TaxID=1348612 RepID=A0A397HWJ2_9GLOM|nr:hypothetical protein Glove_300g68 [Diversispora epigaea]